MNYFQAKPFLLQSVNSNHAALPLVRHCMLFAFPCIACMGSIAELAIKGM